MAFGPSSPLTYCTQGMISPQESKACTIRKPRQADEASWRKLWAQYVAFYEAEISEEVTNGTWQRMLAEDSGMFGRVAERDGVMVGFSVCILHAGSWTLDPTCYLEDLFVDPAMRGRGVGKALIDDLVMLGRERGWSRLYWHTRASNAAARKLYDTFAEADDFVRYRLFLR